MEYKKGLLATGILMIVLLIIMVIVVLVGWGWFSRGQSYYFGNVQDPNPEIILDIPSEALTEYVEGIGYICESDNSKVNPIDSGETCSKSGEKGHSAITITILYLYQIDQPSNIMASATLSKDFDDREFIYEEFKKIIQIPFQNTRPDEAVVWLSDCMKLENQDYLIASKSINQVTFTLSIIDNRYTLSINPNYEEY
jgi:hypothetical protein